MMMIAVAGAAARLKQNMRRRHSLGGGINTTANYLAYRKDFVKQINVLKQSLNE